MPQVSTSKPLGSAGLADILSQVIECIGTDDADFAALCDAALFLASADSPITKLEVRFLKQARQKIPRLIFILNRMIKRPYWVTHKWSATLSPLPRGAIGRMADPLDSINGAIRAAMKKREKQKKYVSREVPGLELAINKLI